MSEEQLGSASLPRSESPPNQPDTLHSSDLLKGRKELWIEHNGEIYRLRLTSRGKLYLTK